MSAYLTPEQFAEHFGISRRKVYDMLKTRAVKGVKLGPLLWRIPRAELAAYEQRLLEGEG